MYYETIVIGNSGLVACVMVPTKLPSNLDIYVDTSGRMRFVLSKLTRTVELEKRATIYTPTAPLHRRGPALQEERVRERRKWPEGWRC